MKTFSLNQTRQRGMSMVELMSTIAILGILTSIAVTNLGGIFGKSKDAVAENVLSSLNKATREFSHSQWDLRFTGIDASSGDELYVLRTLQWRDPDTLELNPKGPFMRIDWNPTGSSSEEDHRLQWTGSAWKLIYPETAGTGLKVQFDGSDLGTSYVHPNDFTPVGSK